MSLNGEWKSRVILWMDELKKHFFRELGAVEFAGFITKEQLSITEALKGRFVSMPEGVRWGAKWEYGWFKGRVVLPETAAGRRIVLRPDLGGESKVYINGDLAGAIDLHHREITLSLNGIPGQEFEIVAESYAGHGPRVEDSFPVPPGRVTVPEPGPTQVTVGRSTFGIWEEEAYQLWIDIDTLYQIRCNINENSLRVAEIDRGLKDFTLMVDFELPTDERIKTFTAARRRLAPLLNCVNGSTAPTMYIFGQSHLDLAWLWPWAETERKCARTLATQLKLMEEYPEYRFLLTQPPCYLILKEKYPRLYEKVKEKVANGRIIPEGGMWVEADTNLPGGESLIRQFIYGKRFFREEFGINSELLWLPDSFGFSAALPQIMKGCGIKYFCTKKILDNYHGGDPFPYNLFMWEGIDGSRVLAHIIRKCNSPLNPETLIKRWEIDRKQNDDLSTFLFPFGYGDGGGGPVRDHLEYGRRMKDLEGVPRTSMTHPNRLFEEIEAEGLPENRYVGELYFQAHRGTYTSQAKTKQGNRRGEFALRQAEMWGAIAKTLHGWAYPYDELERTWKMLLFNQFHDILPGSSIQRVHAEAEADYRTVLENATRLKKAAVANFIKDEAGAFIVFNSLSWDRRELVPVPQGFTGVRSSTGRLLPVQQINGQVLAEVEVPSCGWTTFQGMTETTETSGAASIAEPPTKLQASERRLENEFLKVDFNELGEITSIFDKEAREETAAGVCNSFKMYKDIPTRYDAWDIDSMYEKLPVTLNDQATIRLVSAGPLVAKLQIKRRLNNSLLIQEISLRRGSRRVEFKTAIDWRENHKLLKVAFPVNLHTDEGIQEIQFGHVRRSNHRSRQYDADRFEVCHHKWTAVMEENRGFALLNDCKYGVNVFDGSINLTLLKAALAPDMYADRGRHEFTYACYIWNGPFSESNVVREAYELNSPLFTAPGSAGERTLFKVDSPHIIIETVKMAEDQSADLIIRLYEAKRTTTRCLLFTSLPVTKAVQTNMLEKPEKELAVREGRIELKFKPFEIKTVRLQF